MNEFYSLLEQVKFLFESGLYEDVKILSDMLLAWSDSPSLASTIASSTNVSTTSSAASSQQPMLVDDPVQTATSASQSVKTTLFYHERI